MSSSSEALLDHCLDADRGEKESVAGQKYSNGIRFKNLRRGENETEVSFPPRFLIAPDEQPVPAIGLESSS